MDVNGKKPRAVITIVFFDGPPYAAFNGGGANVTDLIMAAGLLEREADAAFDTLKMSQALDNRSKIQTAPAIPGLKVRD